MWLIQLSFQGTFSVCDLDFDKTYEKLQGSNDMSGISEISKGTFTFWMKIDKSKLMIQISNKGKINIWHSERSYIDKVVEKLKPLMVLADGEICEELLITKMQKIGATKIASSTYDEIHSETSLSNKSQKARTYEKRLDVISQENLADPFIAYSDLISFVPMLPSNVKKQIDPDIQQLNLAMLNPNSNPERVKRFLSLLIPLFVNKIIQLLNEKNEMSGSKTERIEFDPIALKLDEKEIEKIVASAMKDWKKRFKQTS